MTKYTVPGQHINCKKCKKELVVTVRKQTICPDCRQEIKRKNQNRPFTTETPYLVWLWHSKGYSFQNIALSLGRTIDGVKEAYMQYLQSKDGLQ